MSTLPPATVPAPAPRLRLWPGILAAILLWACIKVPGLFDIDNFTQFMVMLFGSMAAVALFLIWWLFLSRARWYDRILGLETCALIGFIACQSFHPSLGGPGAPNRLESLQFTLFFNVFPWVLAAWVGWLLVSSFLSMPLRRLGLVIVLACAWAYPALLRMDGLYGSFNPQISWRWNPTQEDAFLKEAPQASWKSDGATASTSSLALGPTDWPGFRGPDRDSRRPGVRVDTDWKAHPPKLLWKHRIGPGWSSFAVVGKHLYTQEQRGSDEAVVCYDADTGKELWVHTDQGRFTEPLSGPGPRATPTFHEGKLYALEADGKLNCLSASTGKVIWTANISTDSGAKPPTWGFSSSPLVSKGKVTVWAGGKDGKGVLAYDQDSGKLAWKAGDESVSYSSTHLARFAGVEQILIANAAGVTSFDPASGKVLWRYEWPAEPSETPRIVQPALVGNDELLIGTGFNSGTRRLKVSRDGDKWNVSEVWKSKAIKPYFNDFVVHKGHAYGFDGQFFVCINLEDGKGKWRERGYGSGQVLLLPDQDLLFVLSEKGEGVLLQANPAERKELARLPMIEGKTWNHPVIAGNKLFVRNDQEIACFELAPESHPLAAK